MLEEAAMCAPTMRLVSFQAAWSATKAGRSSTIVPSRVLRMIKSGSI